MPIGSSDLRRLVGRADEMELLASLVDAAREAGSALVIKGEPGVGKSRLLAEGALLARERGFAVLTTTGVQSEANLGVRRLASAPATGPLAYGRVARSATRCARRRLRRQRCPGSGAVSDCHGRARF